jgi:epoxyqueuosine reductase
LIIDKQTGPLKNKKDTTSLSKEIKAEARNLGFFTCGIAKADTVDDITSAHIRHWLAEHDNAGMDYMGNYTDKRLNPQLLMDGLKSIVSVALNYTPSQTLPPGQFQFSAYALGQDYHEIVKKKLKQLAEHFHFEHYRVFCDSAPVLERYWAEKAGLGWTGRNHQLIIPQAGSMFFLGELFLDQELDYDQPMKNHCGKCHRCIDACPTHALRENQEMDANLCLSYQLIENRGNLSESAKEKMGNVIYGCDRCQTACPWNQFAIPNHTPELQPRLELLKMTKEDWENLTVEEYHKLFKGSAVKRVKYSGLMRNIKAAQKTLEEEKKKEDDDHTGLSNS